TRWLQQSNHMSKNRIQQGLGMPHVKIERREIATKMQLRVVTKGAATIEGQPILDGPAQNVPQRVTIKAEIARYGIVKAEIFVIDRTIVHHANAEGDDAIIESPDEKTHAFGHELAE